MGAAVMRGTEGCAEVAPLLLRNRLSFDEGTRPFST